ncbi:MAG: thioredoxin [Candidatus Aenigmatarchaeota archaeon]
MPDINEIKKKKLDGMKKKAEAPSEPVQLNDSDFSAFIKKYPVVVVDAYTDWCGPCKMMAPVIDELAREFAGKVVFGKLDVDANPQISAQFGIMSIPTVLFFRNGEYADTMVGFGGKEALKKKIEELLG